jgi:hypothetical protein
MTGRALAIRQMLVDEGITWTRVAALMSAIEFRMEASARLSRRPEMQAWLPGDEKEGYGDALRVAAAEPLLEHDGRPALLATVASYHIATRHRLWKLLPFSSPGLSSSA